MRAFMSDRAARDQALAYSADWPEWERAETRVMLGQTALAEARRILAETEPAHLQRIVVKVGRDGRVTAAERNRLNMAQDRAKVLGNRSHLRQVAIVALAESLSYLTDDAVDFESALCNLAQGTYHYQETR